MGTDAAWRLLAELPAWEVTEIPRTIPEPGDQGADGSAAGERLKRMLALASLSGAGEAAAFGWVRQRADGPVRVIAAGRGIPGDGPGHPEAGHPEAGHPEAGLRLGFPAGAAGAPLPSGELAEVLTTLPCWLPVAVVPDALACRELPAMAGTGSGPSPEDGLLGVWTGPFGYLVLASPVDGARHADLLLAAALAQGEGEANGSPRAQIAARRWKARHEELREALATGLWDIWLLAGGASPEAAARVAGLLTVSLDLRGLPFALKRLREPATLPVLLGAPPETGAGREPGPVAREVLGYAGDPRGSRPRTPSAPIFNPNDAGGFHAQQFSSPSSMFSVPEPPAGTASTGTVSAGTVSAGTGPRPAWLGGAQGQPGAGADSRSASFPDPEPQFPYAGGSMLLAALAVPPAQEVPGVRMVLRPRFDVTPEQEPGAGDGIGLGTILNGNRAPTGVLEVSASSLNRHTFVCGATGSGKSQTVRHLLESATHAGIPWLVIEPAKAEYRLMAERLPGVDVVTIRPGNLDVVPAGINPLEPAAGPDGTRFPLQAHADLVRALFLAAFRADEPFPQVLSAALERCYTEAGWDLLTGQRADGGPARDASYPGLGDLQRAALAVVEQIGYSQEITDNVRGFVSVRIGSLRSGTTGGFLDGAFPLDYGSLLSGNVVMEIEDCGDDSDKGFLTGAVLIRLTEHLRMRARAEGHRAPGLRHLTVIEEAHRLLRQPAQGEGGGPAAHAVEMFAGLLAEIRAYGEGLVIAEQIPSKLIPDVIKNTAVKVVHRLPAKDDRDAVGATMNLTDDQSRFLVTLTPGEAAVFTDGMDYPVLARMPDGTDREAGAGRRPVLTARSLVTGRSRSCPQDCVSAPCTLGMIAAARQARARDPRITFWAELAVTAHLAGWAVPLPGPPFREALGKLNARERNCALAHAAERAAASRVSAMAPRVDPAALAAHAAGAMRAALNSRKTCRAEQQWLAPACELALVAEALKAAVRDGQAGRHPASAAWEQMFARPIPGESCAAQLAVVSARQEQDWAQPGKRIPVLFGTATPSALENAVGSTRDAPDWRDRVLEMADGTLAGRARTWIPDILAPVPSRDAGKPAGPAGKDAAS